MFINDIVIAGMHSVTDSARGNFITEQAPKSASLLRLGFSGSALPRKFF
jgi:hypothetical protein